MAKLKLGNRPKNFKRVVKFDMLDGSKCEIEAVFKYRTRSEFGAFIDGLFKQAKDKDEGAQNISMAELMEKTRETNADYLLDILDGWDLDTELSRDALQQLSDEVPGAVGAMMEAYRAAIIDGRVGN
mgnify:CR=1 FL=1|jgi:hypothetical protein